MREASPDVFRWLSYSRQGVFLQKGRKLNWYKLSTHNRPIVGSNPTRPTTLLFQEVRRSPVTSPQPASSGLFAIWEATLLAHGTVKQRHDLIR
jgi:hypothetical protein